MKLFLIAALAILASAQAEDEVENNYIYFPEGEGVPQLIDLSETYEEIELGVDDVTYNLFTRWNRENAQALFFLGKPMISNSNFLRTRSTRVIIHGWQSDQWSEAIEDLNRAYLIAGDYNIIRVDWSRIGSGSYAKAAANVKNIATHVSSVLSLMSQEYGLDLSTTQVIGHSLGAHIAGIAARGTDGSLQGVVALDPALPGFENAGAGSGIHHDDALNVQVIHTNAGQLGLLRAAGTSDFYPNGGSNQPGCELDTTGSCAHLRSFDYFIESILDPTGFRATEASDVFMGSETLTTATGSFTLDTAASSPFALG